MRSGSWLLSGYFLLLLLHIILCHYAHYVIEFLVPSLSPFSSMKAQSAAGWRQKVAFLNQFWQLLRVPVA
jgi:hypothetical protein